MTQPLTIQQLEDFLIKQISKLEPVGEEHASKKATYENLEEQKKAYLASLVIKEEGKSHSERECKAMASKDYKIFIEGKSAAYEVSLKAQVVYDNIKIKIEALRTLISNRRVEFKQFKA